MFSGCADNMDVGIFASEYNYTSPYGEVGTWKVQPEEEAQTSWGTWGKPSGITYEKVADYVRLGYNKRDVEYKFGGYRKMNTFNKWLDKNNLSWSRDFKPLFKQEIERLAKLGFTAPQILHRRPMSLTIRNINLVNRIVNGE